MKVQLTLDISDDQRIAIGLAETGLFVPAKQTEIRDYATEIVMRSINGITSIVTERREDAIRALKDATDG